MAFTTCKESRGYMSDRCAACKLPMHFACGGVQTEGGIQFCDLCFNQLGDVDDVVGRIARRTELEADIAPFYLRN